MKDKPTGSEALAEALKLFATKSEVQSVAKDVEAVDAELKALKTEIVQNGEARKNHILGVIDGVRKESAAQAESIHKRIDDLPLKIKELLNL